MGFDDFLGTMTAAMADQILGSDANASYLPPLGVPGAGLRIRVGLGPIQASTLRDFQGRDERSQLHSQADIPVGDFGDIVPVKSGRLRMDDRGDPALDLTIVEEPVLQAGQWTLVVEHGKRQQIGLPRVGN